MASIHCTLGTVLDVLYILTHLIFPTLYSRYHNNLYFIDEETGLQREVKFK